MAGRITKFKRCGHLAGRIAVYSGYPSLLESFVFNFRGNRRSGKSLFPILGKKSRKQGAKRAEEHQNNPAKHVQGNGFMQNDEGKYRSDNGLEKEYQGGLLG